MKTTHIQYEYRSTKREATFIVERKKSKRNGNTGGDEPHVGWQKKEAREARKRQKEGLVAVATYNVRTLAVRGKDG